MRNRRNVDAASGDIGSDENASLSAAERLQRPHPGILRFVAVDSLHRQTGLSQKLADLVGTVLGTGEDQDAIHARMAEQLQQEVTLGLRRDEVDFLVDAVHGDLGR